MLLPEALSRDRIWGKLFDKIDTRFPRMDHEDLLVTGVDTNTSMGMVDVEHEQCHSAVGRFSPLQCFCDLFRLLSQHNKYACCNNIPQEAAVVQPGSTHNQSYRTGYRSHNNVEMRFSALPMLACLTVFLIVITVQLKANYALSNV